MARILISKKSGFTAAVISFFLIALPSMLSAAQDYRTALYDTIYYFGAQRCGTTNSWIHDTCHTKDGQAQGIDLTGGWHDCGDHVKYMGTGAFAAGVMLVGYENFKASYEDRYSQAGSTGSPNGIPDILDEVKVYTDFLLKACNGGKVYFQVGNFTLDHMHFSEPHDYSLSYTAAEGGESDASRPVFSFTSGGSNICGKAAATLALMAINYQPYDAAYATSCFNMAKTYYAIGDSSHTVQSDAQGGFYSESKWNCHLAWGAIEIYRASVARGAPDATYLTAAENYFSGAGSAGSWPLTWDQTPQMACFELYKTTGLATYKTWLQAELAYYKANLQTCGIGQYWHWSTWGNLKVSAAAAFVALLTVQFVSADATAQSQAKSTLDFILGTHGDISGGPYTTVQGTSFVVGYTNPDYPSAGSAKHPHHRAAFGYTKAQGADAKSTAEDSAPGTYAYNHVLLGSLVGGPEATCGSFNDQILHYSSTEGGLDYNGPLVAALGALIFILNPPTPTNTPTPNLSMTRTFTATISPTFTITPIPPATHKLNLQIRNNGGGDSCTTQDFKYDFKIINYDTTDINLSTLQVKMWFSTTDTITNQGFYNGNIKNNAGTQTGNVQSSEVTTAVSAMGSSCQQASDRKANTVVTFSFTSAAVLQNGGGCVDGMNGALTRGSYMSPMDPECDDYSKLGSATYHEDVHFALYESGKLVCEYTDPVTQDALTGVDPCTGATGCPGNTTPTNTPFSTATFTRTPTRTFTTTLSPTATFTITLTATSTMAATKTFTPTFTWTLSNSSTATATQTGTYTSTATATQTGSYTSTATATQTVTATRTNTQGTSPTFTDTPSLSATPSLTATVTFSPSATSTFTMTSTGSCTKTFTATNTATYTPTFTPTFSATLTDTLTSTSTFTFTSTYTRSATPTRTPSYTDTPTFTATSTPTFTISSTYTVSPTDTPYAGSPTDSPTVTNTMTATPTATSTPTPTDSQTLTCTPTSTPTATATQSVTSTATFTVTGTITQTLTETPPDTETSTPTRSMTSTASGTVTATLTLTCTLSATATYTVSPQASATNTWTPSPSGTNTAVPTFTTSPTPTWTLSATPSFTATPINTGTATPPFTATKTQTFTATAAQSATATWTSTPLIMDTATPGKTYEIATLTPVVIWPNPNVGPGQDREADITVTRATVKIEYKLYTRMGRLIRYDFEQNYHPQGRVAVIIKGGTFQGLARGIYFMVITAHGQDGEKASSEIQKILIN